MKKKRHNVDYLFFDTQTYQKDIVTGIVEHLGGGKLFVVPHSVIIKELIKNCPANLRCILCRRMMFRIANKIAKKHNYKALVTGENLAQVASQTLPNLILEHQVSKIPILQPLLCMDKKEIVKIARKIRTFEYSKEHKCCGFVPPSPRTKGREEEIENAEKNLNINKVINNSLEQMEIKEF